jgi:hypothetical protein
LNDFAVQLREWQIFYSTVSLASVTLAGLLFVSLSLHSESFKSRKNSFRLRLARGSFGDFLYVLMLGLVFLVPHQAPFGLAVALFVLGAARSFGLTRQAVRTVRKRAKGEPITGVLREIALPALASLGLIIIGVEVLRGNYLSFYGLVLVVAALLATASWNAWLILVEEDAEVM